MNSKDQKQKSKLALWLDKWLGLGIFHLLALLPFRPLQWVGKQLGTLAWHLNGSAVKVTKTNIDACYPELAAQDRKALAKRSIQHTGILFAEMCALYTKPNHWISHLCKGVEGEHIMRAAVAQNKGVIILAPHIGNWELFSQILPQYGKVSALYRPLKKPHVDQLVLKAREGGGMQLIPISRRGMVELIKAIKSGGITSLLPDQCPARGNGDYAPFFGFSTYTVTLVHSLLQRCDSPVVFALNKRTKDGFVTHFIEPEQDIYSNDKKQSLGALNRGVEACIRLCPEQYQWEYKRFKHCAEGERQFY